MNFPILDSDVLIVNSHDITTFYGRPTYYYRGVEIGHRQHVIEQFEKLQKIIFEESGKIATEAQLMTTITGGVQTKISCGTLIHPDTRPGYNVCGRIKFIDGTFGTDDTWAYHRRSTTTDGAAVYCAKHFIDDVIENKNFRKVLIGTIDNTK